MKINITKKEYRLLLDMLQVSDWVLNSHAELPDERHLEHEELVKKFLSYYKEMEAEDIIEHSIELDDFFPVNDYETAILGKFIEPYDDSVFWEQLIDRLSLRDAVQSVGDKKYQEMDGIDRLRMLDPLTERYTNEFEQHGLKYVKIDHEDMIKK